MHFLNRMTPKNIKKRYFTFHVSKLFCSDWVALAIVKNGSFLIMHETNEVKMTLKLGMIIPIFRNNKHNKTHI